MSGTDVSTVGAAPGPAGGLLAGYGAIAFDCDGVLLDSNALKTRLFRDVASANGFLPDEVAAFSAWQNANFGTSRYRIFQALVEGTFGPRRDVTLDTLLEDFGRRCLEGYMTQPETPGMREALARAGAGGRPLYVVSGSDQEELRTVFAQRGLADLFVDILGSPTAKTDNLRDVCAREAGKRLLFVGDAFADMKAANENGADFVLMAAYSTVRGEIVPAAQAAGWPVIETLTEFA